MRVLIENAVIIDGSGGPAFLGQLLLEQQKIAAVFATDRNSTGKSWRQLAAMARQIRAGNLDSRVNTVSAAAADLCIDASGLVAAPGFIDTHRHADLSVLTNPSFGELELAQGITTVLNGNCGLTPYPTTDRYRKQWLDFIEPCLGRPPKDIIFRTMADYFQSLQKIRLPLNCGSHVGTGAVKVAAKGFSRTPFSPTEMARAKSYLEEALQAGAIAISSGLMYVPECYSDIEEFTRLLSNAVHYDPLLTCHIRGEGDSLPDSVSECIQISRRTGLRLNISHFKAVGIKNWSQLISQAIEIIETSDADVSVDFYPYLSGSTTLLSLLPPDIVGKTLNETINSLSTPIGVTELKQSLQNKHPGWDNMVEAIGWDRIFISDVSSDKNQDCIGRSMADAADEYDSGDSAALLCRLLKEEQGKIGIIVQSMSQGDVDSVARLPYASLISDALYGPGGKPHPRAAGSFPRLIRDMVLDRQLLTLETAVHKMSGLPASRFGLEKRGFIRPGYLADINLFDPEQIRDRATYQEPKQSAAGIDTTFISGQIVRSSKPWKGSRETFEHSGRSAASIIRRKQ